MWGIMASHGSTSRTYTQKGHRGIAALSTWSMERCVICQRFLAKHQQKYCAKHGSDVERHNRSHYRTPESIATMKLRVFVRYHINEIEVGQIV